MTLPSLKFGILPQNFRQTLTHIAPSLASSPDLTQAVATKLAQLGFEVDQFQGGSTILEQKHKVDTFTPEAAMAHLETVATLMRDNEVYVADCDRPDNLDNQQRNKGLLRSLTTVLLDQIVTTKGIEKLLGKLQSLPFVIPSEMCTEISLRDTELRHQ